MLVRRVRKLEARNILVACCEGARAFSSARKTKNPRQAEREEQREYAKRRFPWQVVDPHADLSSTEFTGQPMPKSVVFKHIPDETKWQIYRRYKADPTPETMTAVAREYRIERPRAEMIVQLKELAEYYINTGRDPTVGQIDPTDPNSPDVSAFDELFETQKDAWIQDHDMSYEDLTTDYVVGADEAHKGEGAVRIFKTKTLGEDEIFEPPKPLSREEAEEFDANRRRRRAEAAREARARSVPTLMERMRVESAPVREMPAEKLAAVASAVATAAAEQLSPFGRAAAPKRKAPWKYAMIDTSVKDSAALVRDEMGRLRIATEAEERCLSWNKTGRR